MNPVSVTEGRAGIPGINSVYERNLQFSKKSINLNNKNPTKTMKSFAKLNKLAAVQHMISETRITYLSLPVGASKKFKYTTLKL